jgi:hypothetical protein
MSYLLVFYSLLIFLLIYCIYSNNIKKQNLENQLNKKNNCFKKYVILNYFNQPNTTTRNMSYDLRGDPLKIPKQFKYWNYSALNPI